MGAQNPRSKTTTSSAVATAQQQTVPRILLVDDDENVRATFINFLSGDASDPELDRLAANLFGDGAPDLTPSTRAPKWRLSEAAQGDIAIREVEASRIAQDPFAVAFVDMRMPPGPNGAETATELRRLDPAIEIVICTAYSDFRWDEVIRTVGGSEGLHLLRKPFKPEQATRLCEVLSTKWANKRRRTA